MNTTSSDVAPRWDAIMRYSWHPTFTTEVWGLIISLLTLLFRAAAIGLFRIWRLGLFSTLHEASVGWITDQLHVALVNIKSPLDVVLSKPARTAAFKGIRAVKRTKERAVATMWLLGAMIFTVFPLGTSSVISLATSFVAGTPGSPSSCAVGVNSATDVMARYLTQISLDNLRWADNTGFNYHGTTASSIGLSGPRDLVKVSNSCPGWAPVCDEDLPLRVDMEYSLKPADLGIGGDNLRDVEFGVRQTCYKVESHTMALGMDSTGHMLYGLMYGGRSDKEFPNVTDYARREEAFGYGYSLSPVAATRSPADFWRPNDTLAHDGDLALLIYHIAAVQSFKYSGDTLFRTNDTQNRAGFYSAYKSTVPIMCNTSYIACLGGRGCQDIDGTNSLLEFAQNLPGDLVTKGFFMLMAMETATPPIYEVSGTSDSIFAGRTLVSGKVQYGGDEVSGQSEIIRLSLAGRARLITAARRAASGWQKYVPPGTVEDFGFFRDDSINAVCGATLVESTSYITVAGPPLAALLVSGLGIFLLSYSGPLWRLLCWRLIGALAIRWITRGVGQLHRLAHEKGNAATYWEGGADEWPEGRGDICLDRFGLVPTRDGLFHPVYSDEAEVLYKPRKDIS